MYDKFDARLYDCSQSLVHRNSSFVIVFRYISVFIGMETFSPGDLGADTGGKLHQLLMYILFDIFFGLYIAVNKLCGAIKTTLCSSIGKYV